MYVFIALINTCDDSHYRRDGVTAITVDDLKGILRVYYSHLP
jgi:hypothetical protein